MGGVAPSVSINKFRCGVVSIDRGCCVLTGCTDLHFLHVRPCHYIDPHCPWRSQTPHCLRLLHNEAGTVPASNTHCPCCPVHARGLGRMLERFKGEGKEQSFGLSCVLLCQEEVKSVSWLDRRQQTAKCVAGPFVLLLRGHIRSLFSRQASPLTHKYCILSSQLERGIRRAKRGAPSKTLGESS